MFRIMRKIIFAILIALLSVFCLTILKNSIRFSGRGYDIALSQVTVLSGPGFYNLYCPKINRLRLSPDKTKIAFDIIDSFCKIFFNLGVVNVDGSDKRLLVRESIDDFVWLNDSEIVYRLSGEEHKDKLYAVNMNGSAREHSEGFDFSHRVEIPEIAKTRINRFLKSRYKRHYGSVGGIVNYEVISYAISPDKSRIAFLIMGSDGHFAYWKPKWYVCSFTGENIVGIYRDSREVSEDAVWLSNNELMYVKDSRLWKAVIK